MPLTIYARNNPAPLSLSECSPCSHWGCFLKRAPTVSLPSSFFFVGRNPVCVPTSRRLRRLLRLRSPLLARAWPSSEDSVDIRTPAASLPISWSGGRRLLHFSHEPFRRHYSSSMWTRTSPGGLVSP